MVSLMNIQLKNYSIDIFHEEHHDKMIIWLSGQHEFAFRNYLVEQVNCCLVIVNIQNWNEQLSPWQASVFKSNDFSGGGQQTYDFLINDLVPYLKDHFLFQEVYVAGYSLAGLFALYVLSLDTDLSGAICCSGSLWFPHLIDFLKNHQVRDKKIYLSLGNKEHQTKHHVLSTIKQKTERVYRFYQNNNICFYQLHQGNHFQDVQERLLAGMKWIERGSQ